MAGDSVGKISLDIDLVAPLNRQVASIGNNIAKSLSGSVQNSLSKSMDGVQSSLNRLHGSISGTIKKVAALFGVIELGRFAKASTSAAVDVEASLGQIDRLMGSSAASFENWANTQAKAFNMSRSEALQYGAVFGNLISSFSQSTAQTAQYTQDLLKTASIVASGTGRTMNDVLERIRSGLLGNTEAIEDLGINVNIAMIESTRAFQQFANGRSWDQLDFQTQQLIRYFAILEQASAKFGNSVANNTSSRLAQFNAILSNIKLNLGNAFLPLLNAVLPALTAFAAKVESITAKIAQFFQVLFGKNAVKQTKTQTQSISQQTAAVGGLNTALGNTAKTSEKISKAQKKVFKSLAGFDEITNIKTSVDTGPSDSGSGGGAGSGGGGGVSTIPAPGIDTSAFDKGANTISKRVKELAEKVRAAFQNMANFVKKHNNEIIASLAGLAAAFLAYKAITNWGKAMAGLREAFKALRMAILGISAPALIVAGVIGLLVGALVYLWRTNEDFRKKVFGIWDAIKSAIGQAVDAVIKFVGDMVSKIQKFWQENGAMILQAAQNIFDGIVAVVQFVSPIIIGIVKSLWENVKGLISGALDIILGLVEFFAALLTGDFSNMWEGVKRTFKGAFQFIWSLFDLWLFGKLFGGFKAFAKGARNIFKAFTKAVKGTFKDFFDNLIVLFNYFRKTGSNIWKAIVDTIKNIVSTFVSAAKANFKGFFDYVKNIFNNFKPIADNIKNDFIKPIENWLKNTLKPAFESVFNSIKNNVNGAWNTLKTVASYIYNNFVVPIGNWLKTNLKPVFDMVFNGIKTVVNGAWTTIKTVGSNIYNSFIKPVANWLNNNLKPVFSSVFNGIKSVVSSAWNTIKNVAGWITSKLGGVVSYVSGKFKSGWSSAWNGIKTIFSKVFNGLWGIVKKPINMIIDGINVLIRGLNKFKIDIPDWIAKLIGMKGGKFGFNIPTIPRLARGGIIDQPTLAWVGEAGKEAVMPLENNTGWIRDLAGQITEQMNTGIGDRDLLQRIADLLLQILNALLSNNGDIVLKIGETELGRAAIKAINTVQRQTGRTLLKV